MTKSFQHKSPRSVNLNCRDTFFMSQTMNLSFPERSKGNEVAKIEIRTWRRKDFGGAGMRPRGGGV